ncbi:energy coupling factor transporter S component ThiW [Isachenkonia alkalipeptolytica]|uniref:Energy coupling factor transporter S component ThiW n=1 Tax=Isachenkonia alkalipeptolytica TaxID=2565777 RepID=A0AA44BFM0_9CLOT|nr:energy coupling factor transporter S component ThiW [Isachenkonia alkalipeptolytica]NBG88616.1 energy coupling factor transporter S component ThiW [Isachenkonia alkalipeptolytica]
MNTRKLTTAALLITVGVLSAHLISIPIGVSRVFPVQHALNVLAAVLFGPYYAVVVAFVTSLLRNILGTGSLLAFPGSIFGAYLAGLLFLATKKSIFALGGEIFGTGILGALAAYPIARYLLGAEVAVFFYIGPFALSSIVGAVIGYIIYKLMEQSGVIKFYHQQGGR